jgi:hypothetical protein
MQSRVWMSDFQALMLWCGLILVIES